jgi:3-hydroxy-9,10-secoandrosta-1,3,5(10)-triene-9,17-dione monooxygenase
VAATDDNPGGYRNTLLKRGEYVIEDVWDTVGLRGTGSNDIVVDDVFVPEHRTLDLIAMFGNKAPGLAVNEAPLYKMPFATLFSYAITGSIIGMAEGMVAEGLEQARKRVSKNWGKAIEDPFTIAALGESACEVDACRLQMFRNLDEMMDVVEGGGRISVEARSQARRDQVMATQRAIAALDDVFDRAGASAIARSNPMQRIWRDAHAGRHHTINTYEKSLNSWGLVALGGNPTDMMV